MTNNLLPSTVAFITGGAGGIGFQIARRYLEEGATVILADIDLAIAEKRVAELDAPGRAFAVQLDVTDEASTLAALDAAEALAGPVNCLIANAGILLLKPVLETTPEEWRRVIDVNLTGIFVSSRVVGQRIVDHGAGGRVIMTSSLFGIRGGVENGAYSAAKFGVIGLMECLAAELAPHGITVNAICPGQIMTPMIEKLSLDRSAMRGTTPEIEIANLAKTIPLGYLAQPEQIADAFVYLASPLSGYTTGQALVVDGGIRVG